MTRFQPRDLHWDCQQNEDQAAIAVSEPGLILKNWPKPGPSLPLDGAADLEQKISTASRPLHLLRLVHAAVDQEVGRCFGQ